MDYFKPAVRRIRAPGSYFTECAEILRRFLEHRLNHQHCTAALDAAVSDVILKLSPDDLPALQLAILENIRIVKQERIKRVGPQSVNCASR